MKTVEEYLDQAEFCAKASRAAHHPEHVKASALLAQAYATMAVAAATAQITQQTPETLEP